MTMFTLGKCIQMCPREEVLLREREGLLHPLEVIRGTEKQKRPKADINRVVKSFSRSAAGNNLANSELLRPANVLLNTVHYLLTDIVNNKQFKLCYIYDFIADRLRSVGQDMVVQSLPSVDRIKILEPIVKFHILFGYRLCEEELRNFDPMMNKKQLREYLKQLLVCYDDIDDCQNLDIVNNMQSLRFKNMDYDQHHTKLTQQRDKYFNRRLIEALYIISNIGDTDPLNRYLNMPHCLKAGIFNLAFEISICHMQSNFVRELKLLDKLPLLGMCAAVIHLPEIRRRGLEIMSHGFSSAALTYPVENVMKCFLYENVTDVISDCRYYGIDVTNETDISFTKLSFNSNAVTLPPKKIQRLETFLSQSRLDDILLDREKILSSK